MARLAYTESGKSLDYYHNHIQHGCGILHLLSAVMQLRKSPPYRQSVKVPPTGSPPGPQMLM